LISPRVRGWNLEWRDRMKADRLEVATVVLRVDIGIRTTIKFQVDISPLCNKYLWIFCWFCDSSIRQTIKDNPQ
jgi:hypothetical protein